MTKCKAHLSKVEQAKLDEAGNVTAAGNEWADELAREGARGGSLHVQGSCRNKQRHHQLIGNFMEANGGWDEKDERWKRAAKILERPHTLKRSGGQWRCEACGKNAGDGADKAKLARTECLGNPATTLGEQARPQCHLLAQTGSFGGAAGVEREQPCTQSFLASRVWSNRGLKNVREAYACYRAAGIPRKTVSLDHRTCSQSKHG